MDDYKPNSHKAKADATEKKVEKVVTGAVKVREKSEAHKFKDIFISDDASNVKNYILMDVLVPAIKKAVKDIVTDGIEMILYGESGRSKNRSTNSDYVSYSKSYKRDDDWRRDDRHARISYSYKDIVIDNRGEAEKVLSDMDAALDKYGLVTVGDYYDLIGVSGTYTDNKYGWTNLRNAEVMRVRDGYTIKLPRAMPID